MFAVPIPGKSLPSRRELLRVGALGLGSLTLADLFRQQATAGPAARNDKAIILLWVGGGPSHLETYDLKPDAPSTTRSLFKPIRTKVPGIDVCELLPKHAAVADKFTLLRSVAHDEMDHGFGSRRFLTGYRDELVRGENRRPWYPSVDSNVFRALGRYHEGMPTVTLVGGHEYRGPGLGGGQFEPPSTEMRHSAGRFGECLGLVGTRQNPALSTQRLEDRMQLLRSLDQARAQLESKSHFASLDAFQRQAVELIASGRVRNAFDLTREPAAAREKYGKGAQHLLLARRLVEAGVRLVHVAIAGKPPYPPYSQQKEMFNWDDHSVNWDIAEAMKMRLPWYDHLVATLIEDIHERGLDQKVMVIVTGEFGRSPRIDRSGGRIGRDHWCRAMSILVSGGGRRRGDVIGATNLQGEHPTTRRYDPHDFLATIYHYLGIPHRQDYVDAIGRPVPLTRGEPIRELL